MRSRRTDDDERTARDSVDDRTSGRTRYVLCARWEIRRRRYGSALWRNVSPTTAAAATVTSSAAAAAAVKQVTRRANKWSAAAMMKCGAATMSGKRHHHGWDTHVVAHRCAQCSRRPGTRSAHVYCCVYHVLSTIVFLCGQLKLLNESARPSVRLSNKIIIESLNVKKLFLGGGGGLNPKQFSSLVMAFSYTNSFDLNLYVEIVFFARRHVRILWFFPSRPVTAKE